MIYEEGIIFQATFHLDLEVTTEHFQFPFCLAGDQWSSENFSTDRNVMLIEPLSNGLNDLTPLQELFMPYLLDPRYVPIEQFAGVTLEEISKLAQETDNACIEVTLPNPYGTGSTP
jgi:hypothetical protein